MFLQLGFGDKEERRVGTLVPYFETQTGQNSVVPHVVLSMLSRLREGRGNYSLRSSPCHGKGWRFVVLSNPNRKFNAIASQTTDGKLYTWGSGVGGRLGHGSFRRDGIDGICNDELEPKLVSMDAKQVGSHTCSVCTCVDAGLCHTSDLTN